MALPGGLGQGLAAVAAAVRPLLEAQSVQEVSTITGQLVREVIERAGGAAVSAFEGVPDDAYSGAAAPPDTVMELPVWARGAMVGMLTIWTRAGAVFDVQDRAAAEALAALAGVPLWHIRREEQLGTALASRDVIGQAKGILMTRHGMTADEAFDMLRRVSQSRNLKLRDVAERVASTGRLPGG